MRAFLVGQAGTNTYVTVPLVPPSVNPDDGSTQTTIDVYDNERPDVARLAEFDWAGYRLQGATGLSNVIWFVIAWDLEQAPADATVRDLGDPESPTWKTENMPGGLRQWVYAAYPDHPAVIANNVRTRADFFRLTRPDDWTVSRKRNRLSIEGGG